MNSSDVTSTDGSSATDTQRSITVIEPRGSWRFLNVRELLSYREILYYLTWRDVKVRYKQSLLGASWAIIQPLMYMIIFTIVFGKMANVKTNGIPYPLFSFSALLLWTYFANSISQASNSVVGSSSIITKIYFPRLSIPFASVGAGLVDFAIGFVNLIGFLIYYILVPQENFKLTIGPSILLVIPLVGLTTLAALGVGTILSALNVAYRDFKHTVPFLVQLWMFATPVIYMGSEATKGQNAEAPETRVENIQLVDSKAQVTKSSRKNPETSGGQGVVPDQLQELLKLNPLIGLTASFRAAVLNEPVPWRSLTYSAVVVVGIFVLGCLYFHRVEDSFADII